MPSYTPPDDVFCALSVAFITAGQCLPLWGADKLCWTPYTFTWVIRRTVFSEFYIPWCRPAPTSLPNSMLPQVLSWATLILWKCTKLHEAITALLILLHWSCDKKVSFYSKHHSQMRYSQASLSAQLWAGLLSILVMVSNKTSHSVSVSREAGPWGWLICQEVEKHEFGEETNTCALQWSPHAFGMAVNSRALFH